MITDEERREVALNLRERQGDVGRDEDSPELTKWDDLAAIVLDPEQLRACMRFKNRDNRTQAIRSIIAGRLADLIEPEPERTCRDVGDGGKFVCSKCCASFDYEGRWDEPTYWVDDVAAAVEYCPNCGARVMYE